MRIAIIGCGLIGQKRAATLGEHSLVVCCDIDANKAAKLASTSDGAEATTDWQPVMARADVNAVIICTTHDMLASIAECAALQGKHALIEKPGARRAEELEPVVRAAEKTGVVVKIGFNHRYHRAFRKAREIFDSGVLGELFFIRARYGHGGRPGYEREWRANPSISGGGEAIDQGMHLIDLARWFMGDLKLSGGKATTYFWDMPVEDNAFFLLENERGRVAFLHSSWTEWKNMFSFEICCRKGKLEISGLGGSYGPERLAHYQMQPEMGPPPTTVYEYPMADDSWNREFQAFVEDIENGRARCPGVNDAQAALRIVERLYEGHQQ
jgi:predicted dehydrogenase